MVLASVMRPERAPARPPRRRGTAPRSCAVLRSHDGRRRPPSGPEPRSTTTPRRKSRANCKSARSSRDGPPPGPFPRRARAAAVAPEARPGRRACRQAPPRARCPAAPGTGGRRQPRPVRSSTGTVTTAPGWWTRSRSKRSPAGPFEGPLGHVEETSLVDGALAYLAELIGGQCQPLRRCHAAQAARFAAGPGRSGAAVALRPFPMPLQPAP